MKVWKEIFEYDKPIWISNRGECLNEWGEAMPTYESGGREGARYLVIKVKVDKKWKNVYIHRLVAQSFVGNPDNLPVVNHIDGNSKNNSWDNLEWTTQGDNVKKRRFFKINKCTDEQIVEMRKLFDAGWSAMKIANLYNMSHSTVWKIVKRKQRNGPNIQKAEEEWTYKGPNLF